MSARRYIGPHSPGSSGSPGSAPGGAGSRFRGRQASRVDLCGLVLFVLPVPLFFGAIGHMGAGDGLGAIGDLIAFAALTLGAWLNREGQRAEAAYQARTVARPPRLPRKIAAAALAGAGVAVAAATGWGIDVVSAGLMGAIATGSHLLAFGADPLRAKGIGHATAGRAADALDQAEAKTSEIRALARSLRDREVEEAVEAMLASLRSILAQVEADPRELSRARRYLSVYLEGALEATRKYAAGGPGDTRLRKDYLDLLGELDANFARGHQTMLLDDRRELEVEIEVLRERLAQEA